MSEISAHRRLYYSSRSRMWSSHVCQNGRDPGNGRTGENSRRCQMQTKFETDKVRPFQFFSPKVDLWKKFIIFKKLGQIDIIINLENENPENLISLEKKNLFIIRKNSVKIRLFIYIIRFSCSRYAAYERNIEELF